MSFYNILAIGDPHFKTDNITETEQFCKELHKYITVNCSFIDTIVVLGDILHTHEKLHTSALNAAVDFFKMLVSFKKKVFVLVGNHDAVSNTIFLTTNHWLNVLKEWNTITVVDYPIKFNISKNEFIILCPYVPEGRMIEALNFVDDWKESRLIFGHQTIDGVKMGMIVAENVEEWKDSYPMLISGHIHDRQRVKHNLYYTGSSLQHSYGEGGDNSICLIKLCDEIQITEIYLSLRRKKILYGSIDDLEKIMKNLKDKNNDVEYKIVLKGKVEDFKAVKKSSVFKEAMELSNVKTISFKQNIIELNEQDKTSSIISDDFCEHLDNLVKKTNDVYLISLYEHIVLGKNEKEIEDIIFID